jgi:hypothetical protein
MPHFGALQSFRGSSLAVFARAHTYINSIATRPTPGLKANTAPSRRVDSPLAQLLLSRDSTPAEEKAAPSLWEVLLIKASLLSPSATDRHLVPRSKGACVGRFLLAPSLCPRPGFERGSQNKRERTRRVGRATSGALAEERSGPVRPSSLWAKRSLKRASA